MATASPAFAYLTDGGIHPPPTTGSYAYYASFGNFGPGLSGFPAKGGSFVDPVFGSTIRRLTSAIEPAGSDIYAKNGFWNADSTRILNNTQATRTIIDSTTGAVIRSGVPGDSEGSFAPDDPDIWYWFNGASLMKYSIASGTSSTVKTFSGSLDPLGGSVDWIDNSGRYMVLNIGGSARVWDKQSDVLYAGAVSTSVGSGWIGITPDGKYVVTAGDPTVHMSYAINHSTRTVNTSGVSFWTLCGDHGDLMSASNGKNYFITHECNLDPGVYAVDITIPQSASNAAKQRADSVKLIALPWEDNDGHISAVSRGAMQDWAFVSVESNDDTFTAGVSGWRAYKQEIVMANVITGEVRRLAHHRSRGLDGGSYYYQPRVNASWDGTRVAWSSNFGLNSPDYSDIYSIVVGTAGTPPSGLTVSFTNPASGATVSGTTTVTMTASGGSGYTYTLKLDGTVIYSGTNATFSWNTTAATNASHTLLATVTDSSGKTGSASRTVTVSNTSTAPMSVTLTHPTAATTLAGTTLVTASVSGATGTSNTFTVVAGGKTVGTKTTSLTAAAVSWNTTSTPNGTQTVTLTVKDATGRTASKSVTVKVSNGTAPQALVASITSPASGATVSGTTNVAVSVSGSTEASHTFKLMVGTTVIGTKTVSSTTTATFSWATTSVANGSRTLSLTVTDPSGRTGSTTRTVTVANIALSVSVTQGTTNLLVSGGTYSSVSVTGASSGSNVYTLTSNGIVLAQQTTSSTGPVELDWDSTLIPNGTQTLTATVRDAAGHTGSKSIAIQVSN